MKKEIKLNSITMQRFLPFTSLSVQSVLSRGDEIVFDKDDFNLRLLDESDIILLYDKYPERFDASLDLVPSEIVAMKQKTSENLNKCAESVSSELEKFANEFKKLADKKSISEDDIVNTANKMAEGFTAKFSCFNNDKTDEKEKQVTSDKKDSDKVQTSKTNKNSNEEKLKHTKSKKKDIVEQPCVKVIDTTKQPEIKMEEQEVSIAEANQVAMNMKTINPTIRKDNKNKYSEDERLAYGINKINSFINQYNAYIMTYVINYDKTVTATIAQNNPNGQQQLAVTFDLLAKYNNGKKSFKVEQFPEVYILNKGSMIGFLTDEPMNNYILRM